MTGILYLCATPIGNLEDMTLRAIRVLQEVDLIAAEDTRNSIRLLNHFEIHTPMTSYHEFNKFDKGKYLIEQLLAGKSIALITDAGTPGISDPGEELVRMAQEAGITVTSLPGACAAVNALILSGKPTRRFCFEAFLPADKKERRRVFDELKTETRTTILYEAPHRLVRTLNELLNELGNRELTLVRELTKKHETVFRTTLQGAIDFYAAQEPKGECVLVLAGAAGEKFKEQEQENWRAMPLSEHMEHYLSQGMSQKDAMKAVAADRGVTKREIYAQLLEEKNEE